MHTYKVELNRRAEFPLDMLRYDDSAPASSDDKALIDQMASLDTDRADLPKRVVITLRSPSRFAPHTGRWESFGVRVVESDNPWGTVSAPVRTPGAPLTLDDLSISKRDADAYEITYRGSGAHPYGAGRVARLRAAFTENDGGVRTATPGTWEILWDGKTLGMGDAPAGLCADTFETAQAAFSYFVHRVLG